MARQQDPLAKNLREATEHLAPRAEVTRDLALDIANLSERVGPTLATAGLIGGLVAIIGRLEHEVVKLTGKSIREDPED